MMKRLLFIPLSCLISFYALGQHSVYTVGGTISGNVTWNNYDTIYITSGLTIGAGSSLTVVPNTSGSDIGTYIVFLGSYGINVSSTGSLTVTGTSSEKIFLTADRAEFQYPKGDKNFGESGETWRNIVLNNTGTSLIENTIIEYGNYANGGGIYVYGNNITIRNSTIQYCIASGSGGGLNIRPTGSNVVLSDLEIKYNTASSTGGGIYFYPSAYAINLSRSTIHHNLANTNGSGIYYGATMPATLSNCSVHSNTGIGIYVNQNVTISNCLIYGNTTGIQFANTGNIINCDIVNNTTGINSTSVSAPKIINSILWGNSTEYIIGTGANLELAYCGVEGGLTGGVDGGGNVVLNSNNVADTGPNFVNPSSNFHLNSWIAPLVDAGTSSYSGVTAPLNDFDSAPRISTIDIGAFEFQYLIWTGNTSSDWATVSNWQGVHTSIPSTVSDNKVIIPAGRPNYPTASLLTLSNRSVLTIQPGAGLTVLGATTVNAGCNFLLKSDVSGTANFITGSAVTGTFNIELFLAGGGSPNYKWHYVLTPVNNHSKNVLTTDIGNSYNLLNYLEYKVTTSKSEGWNWHDGYLGTDGFLMLTNDLGNNVYTTTDQTAVFTGTILSAQDYSPFLFCGLSDPNQNGWNLIGNPFTSSINLDNIIFGENVDPVIYFTRNNSFLTYNNYTHVGTNGMSNIIPPMQGFFIHATDGWDQFMSIPPSARTYSSAPLLKKGTSISEKSSLAGFPMMKFNISDGFYNDESIIYLFEDATNSYDRNYDAYKMLSNNPLVPQIWTVLNNIDFSMNGIPYPENRTEIPIKLRIGETKSHTISVVNLEDLSKYNIYLRHGSSEIDLKTNPSYTFNANAGTLTDMAIVFENISTALSDATKVEGEEIQFWYSNDKIFLKSNSNAFEKKSTIIVYDINGNTIFANNNFSIVSGEIKEIPVELGAGIYISRISNQLFNVNKKLVVTR